MEGDVFSVLPTITPGSVDCVVTSPPYWMLRSYLPKGHALKPLELGSEPTPQLYVENMVKVFRLVRDCMADHATCWLNVGDTYGGGGGSSLAWSTPLEQRKKRAAVEMNRGGIGPSEGNLCLIPQRLMIALQDDGWIVRSVVVWHKPAPMPSSVAGWSWRRCRIKERPCGRSNSRGQMAGVVDWSGSTGRNPDSSRNPELQAKWVDCPGCPKCKPNDGLVLRRGSWRPTSAWEPVIMLAKSPKYFADGEAVKTKAEESTIDRNLYSRVLDDPDEQFAVKHDHETITTSANLRDVWTIAAEPLKEKHYAAYPTELVERCLLAGTSAKGYCPNPICGAPWVRILETEFVNQRGNSVKAPDKPLGGYWTGSEGHQCGTNASKTLGWCPSCRCNHAEPPRPGLVLDPFSGAGRTGETCLNLGLDYVGCELNPEYVQMSRKRLQDASPLFHNV